MYPNVNQKSMKMFPVIRTIQIASRIARFEPESRLAICSVGMLHLTILGHEKITMTKYLKDRCPTLVLSNQFDGQPAGRGTESEKGPRKTRAVGSGIVGGEGPAAAQRTLSMSAGREQWCAPRGHRAPAENSGAPRRGRVPFRPAGAAVGGAS